MNELPEFLKSRGALSTEMDGVTLPRHFGDPAAEYLATTSVAGVVFRAERTVIRVHGRAPRQMLQGILTNSVSDPPVASAAPTETGGGSSRGASRYAAILTPKGRMVADLKQYWFGGSEEEGVALDLPAAGRSGVLEYFARVLPPRLATVEDLSASLGVLTVVGPEGRRCVSDVVQRASPEEGFVLMDGGPLKGGLLVAAGREQPPSWDIVAPNERLPELWGLLEGAGARGVGWGVWETLRVEAGFPRFPSDLTEKTIPLEAGLGSRAFDHAKGCYTGQEVIVRILHRGHVNWHLRTLLFGESTPDGGAELFAPGGDKVVGRVTSSVQSPRFEQVVGLGYVRREVEPPTDLCLGSGSGATVRVRRLPYEIESGPPAS